MGIPVDIYTRERGSAEPAYPHGLTLVEVFGEEVRGPSDASERAPAVIITKQSFSFGEFATAFLAEQDDEGKWRPARRSDHVGPMFNGRFVYTSDGRFAEALGVRAGAQPVPLQRSLGNAGGVRDLRLRGGW